MKNLMLLVFVAISFVACKKDEVLPRNTDVANPSTPSAVTPAGDYLPLQDGNYWVYEIYKKDVDDAVFVPTGIFDTVTVVGERLYRGETHKILVSTYGDVCNNKNPNSETYRFDRNGFLWEGENKVFSADIFGRPIYSFEGHKEDHPNCVYVEKTEINMKKLNNVEVPAGVYNVLIAEKTNYNPMLSITNFEGSEWYAKYVGVVKSVLKSDGVTKREEERRLVSYKINR